MSFFEIQTDHSLVNYIFQIRVNSIELQFFKDLENCESIDKGQ